MGGDRRLYARRLGYINKHAKGYIGAAEASNQRLKLIGRRGQIRDRYSKAVGHQTFGNSSAYSARGTGHESRTVGPHRPILSVRLAECRPSGNGHEEKAKSATRPRLWA